MLRIAARLTPAFMPLFERRHEFDYDHINANKPKELQTGMERVKQMYKRNEFDEVSVELHTVVQSGLTGAFIGACFGGFVKSREAYLYFIENNQATIFKSTLQAKKKLQDYVLVAFAKGAYQWGWKVGIFTGTFSTITTTISVYRGDTSLVEYVIAGTLTGALYKANLGLAATLVGAGLGAVLSTIGGLTILAVLKITGFSMADIRRTLYKIKEAREQQYREAAEKASDIKNDELTKHHDVIVEASGERKLEEL